MYETRQNKEKVSRRIDGGGRVRQKKSMNVMQKAHDLTCKTKIDYRHNGEIKYANGEGENDITTARSVLRIIAAHPQTYWISLQPQVTNEPGKCAEPHSLADALSDINKDDKIIKVEQGPAIFKNEHISRVRLPQEEFDSLKKERNTCYWNEIKKRKHGKERNYRIPQNELDELWKKCNDKFWYIVKSRKKSYGEEHGYRTFCPGLNKGDKLLPCDTCKQWVPDLPKIGIDKRQEYYDNVSSK